MIYGYARVPTTGQILEAEFKTLKAAGADHLWCDTTPARPELARLLKDLKPGDTLLVTGLGHLPRSTDALLRILDQVQMAEAHFRSLADPWTYALTPDVIKLMIFTLDRAAEHERKKRDEVPEFEQES